ncbi:hypothetical protein LXL04_023634 [Taraxacum kok-saghyz]
MDVLFWDVCVGFKFIVQGDMVGVYWAARPYDVGPSELVQPGSSKGIKMVKPKEFSTDTLAGLDWDISKFIPDNSSAIVPDEAITYTNRMGKTSLRFSNYNPVPNQEFEETETETKSSPLVTFLGLVNYARPFIKDLGKIAGPLYSKTFITGQRYFNQEDVKLVQTLKEKIKNLPELALPLDTVYLIIETDGCSQGWGAVLCCKPNKFSEKSLERIYRYNNAELLAISYALDRFELFIISKKEITLRTDCEAIVSFYNKMNGDSKKSSRRRWLNFLDRINNTGLTINIEHIKKKDNKAADILSRSHSAGYPRPLIRGFHLLAWPTKRSKPQHPPDLAEGSDEQEAAGAMQFRERGRRGWRKRRQWVVGFPARADLRRTTTADVGLKDCRLRSLFLDPTTLPLTFFNQSRHHHSIAQQ